MAKKTSGKTKIELGILNPKQFQTLQEIRDFVTGDGAKALHFAIYKALSPAIMVDEADEVEAELKDELKDARTAALVVNNDLEALARGAIESEGDPRVFREEDLVFAKERRALMLIALKDDDANESDRWGIIEYLSGGNKMSATPEPPEHPTATDEEIEPEDLGRFVDSAVTALIHAPVLETAEDVAGYLDGDFHSLCRMATDLANAGVALPAMFYEDLGSLARSAASVLRGEGAVGGEGSETLNYLGDLTAAYTGMVRKLEEDPNGDRRSTVNDGVAGEVCRTTMPLLSRLIRNAADCAEVEWACRHRHAI